VPRRASAPPPPLAAMPRRGEGVGAHVVLRRPPRRHPLPRHPLPRHPLHPRRLHPLFRGGAASSSSAAAAARGPRPPAHHLTLRRSRGGIMDGRGGLTPRRGRRRTDRQRPRGARASPLPSAASAVAAAAAAAVERPFPAGASSHATESSRAGGLVPRWASVPLPLLPGTRRKGGSGPVSLSNPSAAPLLCPHIHASRRVERVGTLCPTFKGFPSLVVNSLHQVFGLASANSCRLALSNLDLVDPELWQRTGAAIAQTSDGFSFVKFGTVQDHSGPRHWKVLPQKD
jgi:hypothetical protein